MDNTSLHLYKERGSELIGKKVGRFRRGKIISMGIVKASNQRFLTVEFQGAGGPYMGKIVYNGREFGSGSSHWGDYSRLTSDEEYQKQEHQEKIEAETKSIKDALRNYILGDVPLEKLERMKAIMNEPQ